MIWLILAVGFILRLINLNQGLWLDEATQAILSQGSITSIIFQRGVDFHPPLSYLIMHFWIKLATFEVWLRLLSVIFGVATVWVVYILTKDLFERQVALWASLFLTLSPYHIYYSQEVRMYAQSTFFASISFYFLHKLLKSSNLIYSFGYILSTASLLYTHYDGFLLIPAQFFYILLNHKKNLKKFILNLLLIFLLWLPWLPQFIIQLKNGLGIDQYLPGWRDVLSLPFYKALPVTFFKFTFGRIEFENTLPFLIVGTIILLIVSLTFFKIIKKLTDSKYQILFLWLFIPLGVSAVISFKIPLNQPFRLLFTLPPFYILLCLGLMSFGKFKNIFIALLLSITILGLSLYHTNPKYQREDWKGAAQFLATRLNQNSLAIFAWSEPFPPFKWYFGEKYTLSVVSRFPAMFDKVEEKLKVSENIKEIYLFEYLQTLSDPNKVVQAVLEDKGLIKNEIYDFRGVGFITQYVKKN